MNEDDSPQLTALLRSDAMAARSRAPAPSPMLAWHRARQRAAQRLERRLRWIALAAVLLLTTALLPALWRDPMTAWWLLPAIAGMSPLWRSLRR